MKFLNALNDKAVATYVSATEAFRNFKRDEKGVTAVEYAIVIAGVAGVVTVIFGSGGTVSTMLTDIFDKIQSAVMANIA